ncbi:MAG TPA: enoyl-[acyl-carrier-protein] reductase FabK [Candidatus Subteraquimicrobiales bacterium]
MQFKTEVCDLLNIKYPILQGGMAWTSTAELAAGVSNAGGLGIIGAGSMPPDVLKEEIVKLRALTDKPFGVNLVLLNNPFVTELVKVIIEKRVPVVTTGAGNPGPFIPELKDRGVKVLPVTASVALAKRLERAGADALITEGMEAGGHVGELTTFVLVPQVAAAVKIPVIAAGGIANGRGMIAAFVLGARGVQLGTRFVCATECTVHPKVKEKILRAKDRDTTVTGYSTGHPVRILKNKLSRELELLDRENKGKEVEERGEGKLRLAMQDGDVDWGSLMAGQSAAMVDKIESAKDIVESLIEEASTALKDLSAMIEAGP